MKKKLVAALLAATMVLSLAACGGKGDGGSEGGAGGSGGGEMYYNNYLMTEPSTLDSIKGNDNYSRGILINTMEPLTRLVEKDGEQVREARGHVWAAAGGCVPATLRVYHSLCGAFRSQPEDTVPRAWEPGQLHHPPAVNP